MLSPQTVRDPASRLAMHRMQVSDTVRHYLILAYQNDWARETNQNLAADQARVKPDDCPLQVEQNNETSPHPSLDRRSPRNPKSAERIETTINNWFLATRNGGATPIEQFGTELGHYWSRLSEDLPAEISADTRRAEWAGLINFDLGIAIDDLDAEEQTDLRRETISRRRQCAFFYFRKRLQLVTTFALAVRAASSTLVEEDANTPAAPANIIQVLVREMQHDQYLIQLCERVASGAAWPFEEEQMMSYLPDPGQQVQGEGQEAPVPEPGRTRKSGRWRDRRVEGRERDCEREKELKTQEEARQEERSGLFFTEESKEVIGNGEESLWFGLEKGELE